MYIQREIISTDKFRSNVTCFRYAGLGYPTGYFFIPRRGTLRKMIGDHSFRLLTRKNSKNSKRLIVLRKIYKGMRIEGKRNITTLKRQLLQSFTVNALMRLCNVGIMLSQYRSAFLGKFLRQKSGFCASVG